MFHLPLLLGTDKIASSTSLWGGEANTPPHTAAVSIPSQTNPACAGSCPEPPPQMIETYSCLGFLRTTILVPGIL